MADADNAGQAQQTGMNNVKQGLGERLMVPQKMRRVS